MTGGANAGKMCQMNCNYMLGPLIMLTQMSWYINGGAGVNTIDK